MNEKEELAMENKKELGNITIKVNNNADSDMQVYKCPHIKCTEYFIDYNDLQSHKVLGHGDMPAFFNKELNAPSKGFSVTEVKRLSFFTTKYVIGKYATMIKLYTSNNGGGNNGRTTNTKSPSPKH